MSKFNNSKGFKNIGKNNSIPITTKISQKDLKKQKKSNKQNDNSNIDIGITDDDFEKMMEENEPKTYGIKLNSANNQNQNKKLYQIPESFNLDDVKKIFESNLKGEELVELIAYGLKKNSPEKDNFNKITGLDLLKGLIDKFNNPEQIDWINPNKYGYTLKYLLDNNQSGQMVCLLMLANFAISKGLVKVPYKNSQIYHIRLLFQLFFTYEIIDESIFWEWQDYLEKNELYDEEIKNKLIIQTTEFYIILKTIFEDEEDKNDDENNYSKNNPNRQNSNRPNSNNELNNNFDTEPESEPEDDEYKVPEEQDYNLDDL